MAIDYVILLIINTPLVALAAYHIRVRLVIRQEHWDLNMVEHIPIKIMEDKHRIVNWLVDTIKDSSNPNFQKFNHMASLVNCITYINK